MIRVAVPDDLPTLTQIYNQAIDEGFLTAHTQHVASEEREKWFQNHVPDQYPIFVYEQQGQVIGWLSFSPYRQGREAASEVAEISFYVDRHHRGKQVGARLTEFSLEQAPALNKKVLFAIVIEGNAKSLELLKKFGF